MELQKNTFRYQRQVARQTAYREEGAESIVPDTLPDIARIVDTSGTIFIRDWEAGSDEVNVKCAVRAVVLYMAEGDTALYHLEVPLSFSQRIELHGAEPGCDILCSCGLLSLDAHALNPRKVSVRVNASVTPRLYARTEETLTTGVSERRECCIRTEPVGYTAVAAVSTKNFTLVEDVDIPETIGSVREVLRAELRLKTTDAKSMAGRLVVKAEAELTALCENMEGEIVRIDHTFGFTQMADVSGAEEGLDAAVDFSLRSFDLDPALDMAGNSRYLSLSAGVIMNMELTKKTQVEIVTDLYGTKRETALTMRDLIITDHAEPKRYRAYAAEHVDAPVTVRRVIDQRFQADEAVEHLAGETDATVGVMVSVLYKGEDGGCYNLVRRLMLRFEVEEDVPARAVTEVHSFTVTVPSGGGLDIELSASVCGGEEKVRRVAMVDEVEWGDEFPQDSYSRMSALIRRAAGDETLWEIAREYHTSVDAIALANQMQADSVPESGELLLIPMKK